MKYYDIIMAIFYLCHHQVAALSQILDKTANEKALKSISDNIYLPAFQLLVNTIR